MEREVEKEGRTKVYSEKGSEQSQSEVTRASCVPGKELRAGSPVLALLLPSA